MYRCIAAKFHEYREMFPKWTINARPHIASVKFNDDGGEGGAWRAEFFSVAGTLARWYTVSITQPAVLRKRYILHFLYDDPNLPPSPSVPADSNGAKEKAAFSGSHFVHQQYSILPKRGRGEEEEVEWAFCLQSPLPSWWSTPAQQAWQQLQWAH